MDEIDLWRAAQLMIGQHGESAALQAAMRSDALLDQGDVRGAEVWRRIVGIINRLEADKPETPGVALEKRLWRRFKVERAASTFGHRALHRGHGHFFRWERTEHRQQLRLGSRFLAQPFRPIFLLYEHGHAVVKGFNHRVGYGRHDRRAMNRLTIVCADVPDAGEAGEPLVGPKQGVALFRFALRVLFPLIPPIRDNEPAAPGIPSRLEGRKFGDGLALGVERANAVFLPILCSRRDKAKLHAHLPTLARSLIEN